MWGLAKMSVRWETDIDTSLKHSLENVLLEVLPRCNEQSLSSMVWAMGLLSVNLHKETMAVLMNAVGDFATSKHMSEQAVANILYGIARLGVKRHNLSLPMQEKLFTCISKVGPRMTPQAVSNSIYALSQIGFQWQDLCSNTRSSLISAIIRQHGHFNQQGLSMTLFSWWTMYNSINVLIVMATLITIMIVMMVQDVVMTRQLFLPLLVDTL